MQSMAQTDEMNSRKIVAGCVIGMLVCLLSPVKAQGVLIPDSGLNAAIRDALQKPSGPLTEQDLLSLTILSAGNRNISSVQGLETARNLRILDLDSNSLTNFSIADQLTNLMILDLYGNNLTSFTLSNAIASLTILDVAFNSLDQCSLPAGLTNLDTLFLENNVLTNFDLPTSLSKLTQLDLSGNQLNGLTLTPDIQKLTSLFIDGNSLATLVLSEPLAKTNLAANVLALRNQGVNVFTYPLAVELHQRALLMGAFQFGIAGPPGLYGVLASGDLANWSEVGITSNSTGNVSYVDADTSAFPRRYYRVLRQNPPKDMVFIPPNTFPMGSAVSELHRQTNEGPQTVVTLTHGFWIGKFEVTQAEYLSVMSTNPSFLVGDLSRPVETVSWPDATNYCAKLTARELAAGHIPVGSQYRLPTEAEWECAARAGTTTRFSYGDDPDYTSLTNHAWYFLNSDLTTHPVGQKLPNPWGLYDMTGNVWEWCQDWLGDLQGGAVVDPIGPPSNPLGLKVVRGGSYDFDETDCRSARRFFFGDHPALRDSDIGFRVVFVIGTP